MTIFGQLVKAYLENSATEPSTFLNKGRIFWDTAVNKAKAYDGAAWRVLGGAGGAGGVSWFAPDGDAPVEAEESNQRVFLYESGLGNRVVLSLKVPTEYSAGDQISMKIGQYTGSSDSSSQLLRTIAYLIREGTDAMSSTTNSHTSTNSALTSTSADLYQEATLDLTDASGEVNSVAVSPGDILRVELYRDTDTDTGEIKFVPSSTEVLFS